MLAITLITTDLKIAKIYVCNLSPLACSIHPSFTSFSRSPVFHAPFPSKPGHLCCPQLLNSFGVYKQQCVHHWFFKPDRCQFSGILVSKRPILLEGTIIPFEQPMGDDNFGSVLQSLVMPSGISGISPPIPLSPLTSYQGHVHVGEFRNLCM